MIMVVRTKSWKSRATNLEETGRYMQKDRQADRQAKAIKFIVPPKGGC